MTDFVLKALQFGVLGLCAVMLVAVWRVLQSEQARDGYPRKGILQASYFFMIFCLVLAVINGYVQLREREGPANAIERVKSLETRLRAKEDRLLKIRSAADPILKAKIDIVRELPPGPAKDVAEHLVESLEEALAGDSGD